MGELTDRVRAARPFLETAIQHVLEAAEAIDNTNFSALHDALSEAIKQRDELRSKVNQLEGDVAFLCGEHDRWFTKYQAAMRENAPLKAQVQNLQEFNDNQRKQLESLQKEMAAIHMCVVADSRTKLYDAMESYTGIFGELPFLLKAVAVATEKAFDSKDAVERYASRIHAARHELES